MKTNDANNQGPAQNPEPAEYRENLLRKLNCLIAVVEVALAKVRVNLQANGADLDRLTRIRLNLENTLNVCRRAKLALERKEPMPAGLTPDLKNLTLPKNPVQTQAGKPQAKQTPPKPQPRDASGRARMTYRDYVEFLSVDEYHKFKTLPAIKLEELKDVNVDELAKKFGI